MLIIFLYRTVATVIVKVLYHIAYRLLKISTGLIDMVYYKSALIIVTYRDLTFYPSLAICMK